MTMLLGLHLTQKLYLISDTRLTYRSNDDQVRFEDNLIKSVTLNKRISSVSAGNAEFASFLIKKIKSRIRDNSSASYLNYIIQNDLEQFIKDYVNEFGKLNVEAGFIFAGFNLNRTKVVNSSLLGTALSADVKRYEGVMVNQSVDKRLTNALAGAIIKNNGLGPDSKIKVDGMIASEMIALKVRAKRSGPEIIFDHIDTYQYSIYHPKRDIEQVSIPNELLSKVDFRDISGLTSENVLYDDAAILATFMNQTAITKKYESVGGNIFVTLVTPEGTLFPTGDMVRFVNGKPEVSSIFVKNEVLCFRLPDGQTGEYRNLENFSVKGNMEL